MKIAPSGRHWMLRLMKAGLLAFALCKLSAVSTKTNLLPNLPNHWETTFSSSPLKTSKSVAGGSDAVATGEGFSRSKSRSSLPTVLTPSGPDGPTLPGGRVIHARKLLQKRYSTTARPLCRKAKDQSRIVYEGGLARVSIATPLNWQKKTSALFRPSSRIH